jgi:hypothetical protein
MEGAMPNSDSHQQQDYPFVDMVLDSIAGWVTHYRANAGRDSGLGMCSRDEVNAIAHDIGLSEGELRDLANRGPNAAVQLKQMLQGLGVDAKALSEHDPLVMRDLQRLCSTCGDKRRCNHELADGTAAAHFHEFCPNSFTLDALLEDKNKTLNG